MTYVDGFLIAVQTARKDRYLEVARETAVLFKKHGALSVVENWGSDVPDGKVTSFPMAVKLKPDETVVFSWITWPSKEARDTGMEAVMQEMGTPDDVPFDGQRMIFGGFETIFEA
ncbi:DUF1428 domain-containing protein [Hyphomonas johnsonii]|jgi:uncharacterized protein YbaA (DUF1428 family)|uniref:RNA signal recognition particle 4.5S RNA n=1 Tax=Hyphomonas johnsonii MHS-2 TaxID=1280950 RepID=A0A059FLZ0_9PROT|nr:DUF1428 domain-containing protein [Hyphomonas johnsonii]KCZ91700.1 hypothetical protein HJO_11302 [Hyphomonas johnsonii MHS-2]